MREISSTAAPMAVENRHPVIIIVAAQGTIADLDRIAASRDLEDRRAVEITREAQGVDGRRGHDQLELGTPRQEALETAEQEIDVQAALVGLIDDQGIVGEEPAIVLQLGQEDPVRHELEVGVGPDPVAETDLVAHGVADLAAELMRDTRRQATRRDAPRLGVAYHTQDAAAQGQA